MHKGTLRYVKVRCSTLGYSTLCYVNVGVNVRVVVGYGTLKRPLHGQNVKNFKI